MSPHASDLEHINQRTDFFLVLRKLAVEKVLMIQINPKKALTKNIQILTEQLESRNLKR
jgi:hypothetical protein